MLTVNETYEQFEARCAASLGLTMEEYARLKQYEATNGPLGLPKLKPAAASSASPAETRTLRSGTKVTRHSVASVQSPATDEIAPASERRSARGLVHRRYS